MTENDAHPNTYPTEPIPRIPAAVDPALANDLALCARNAAVAVAPYLRSVARTVRDFDTKVDKHDPVTVHDRKVEGALQELLALAVPGSRMLGEERGEVVLPEIDRPSQQFLSEFRIPTDPDGVDAMRKVNDLGARVRWIVDPIDGTANFAAGSAYFNTSIAAELDGQVVAGAICVPLMHELFIADSRQMWWEAEDRSETRRLRADGPRTEGEAVLTSYYPGLRSLRKHPREALDHETRLFEAYQAVRRPGASALDLAMVAAGWSGAFMGITFKPWDVAAGIHMIRVAGGTVLNLPLGTNLPDGLRPGVAAAGANLDPVTAKAVLREIAAEMDPGASARS